MEIETRLDLRVARVSEEEAEPLLGKDAVTMDGEPRGTIELALDDGRLEGHPRDASKRSSGCFPPKRNVSTGSPS